MVMANNSEDEWGLVIEYRITDLESKTKTLRMGVMVAGAAGVAGIGMSLFLGKTVAKLAEQMGQIGQITQAMMAQLGGGVPQQEQRTMSGTGAPGPDVPAPTTDGAARVFLAPRGVIKDESITNGDKVSEAYEGPETHISDEVREQLEKENISFNEPAPDAGKAVILDDDDIKPVGQ